MTNTYVIFPFGLIKFLIFLPKNSNLSIVQNQIEVVKLRQHQMQVSPLNYGGQHGDWASFKSQKRYMKKYIKSPLSVSLVAIALPSTSQLTFQ